MKQRLPRRYKKKVKKIVAAKSALKMAMASIVTMQARAQVAIISAQPVPHDYPPTTFIAERALRVAEAVVDTSEAIGKILSEKPNSWRDFIK
jgi:hypothetical protein